jgi:hypothetical protein
MGFFGKKKRKRGGPSDAWRLSMDAPLLDIPPPDDINKEFEKLLVCFHALRYFLLPEGYFFPYLS